MTSEHRDDGRSIAAELAAVAAAGRTGTAWLMAGNVGALYFRNGRVVGAELAGSPTCATFLVVSRRLAPEAWSEFADAWSRAGPDPPPAVPPAAGLGALEWATISLEAILDAAFELLPAGPENVLEDLVFQPDDVPGWTRCGNSVTFAGLRAEIARRQLLLDRLRPVLTPDSTLRRASPEWLSPVQVSAQQWRVLAALGDGATARSVAARLGCGVFGTTLVVRALIAMGMVSTHPASVAAATHSAAVGCTLFSDAAVTLA